MGTVENLNLGLLEQAPDLVWLRRVEDGRLLAFNGAVVRALGYSREELAGMTVYDLHFGPGSRPDLDAWVLQLRGGPSTLAATLKRKDGAPLEAEMRGALIRTPEGEAVLALGRPIGDDAAARRRAATLYQAFKRSNDVMFYCDRNGVILDVNDAFTRHYGYARDEAIGQSPAILRSRHSTNELYKRMWSSILDPHKGYWRGEMINKTKTGREIPLILTITAVRDETGMVVGYVSNAVDVSDIVALQARVAQSEALATIGEMAAVVAHEIRNPLGSIVMAAKQLAAGGLSDDDRQLVLEVLRAESQRLNEALTNFLAFARPRELRLERTDLNALVSEVCAMIESNPELTQGIAVQIELDRKLAPFPMDADQIRQVVWNVILNGVQALAERGGRLRIETGRSGGEAFLRVEDDGAGIPPEMLPDIFKPFRTTKHQGTGLGLAIADRIVKAHGGRIEVQSEPKAGASFTIKLPSAEN